MITRLFLTGLAGHRGKLQLGLPFYVKKRKYSTPAHSGGFPGGSDGKESSCNAGDLSSIPGLGRSFREANGNPLQYSFLGNPMDRRAWRAIMHGLQESWTLLSN